LRKQGYRITTSRSSSLGKFTLEMPTLKEAQAGHGHSHSQTLTVHRFCWLFFLCLEKRDVQSQFNIIQRSNSHLDCAWIGCAICNCCWAPIATARRPQWFWRWWFVIHSDAVCHWQSELFESFIWILSFCEGSWLFFLLGTPDQISTGSVIQHAHVAFLVEHVSQPIPAFIWHRHELKTKGASPGVLQLCNHKDIKNISRKAWRWRETWKGMIQHELGSFTFRHDCISSAPARSICIGAKPRMPPVSGSK